MPSRGASLTGHETATSASNCSGEEAATRLPVIVEGGWVVSGGGVSVPWGPESLTSARARQRNAAASRTSASVTSAPSSAGARTSSTNAPHTRPSPTRALPGASAPSRSPCSSTSRTIVRAALPCDCCPRARGARGPESWSSCGPRSSAPAAPDSYGAMTSGSTAPDSCCPKAADRQASGSCGPDAPDQRTSGSCGPGAPPLVPTDAYAS